MDKNHKIRKRTLQDGHCLLILIIVTAVLFRKALLGGPVILSHPIFLDLTHHIYAWRLYGFGLLKSGTIPLWNPFLFCGTPFVANWHSAIFYPLNVIFLFLPVHVALNYSIALHFFLAGAFTYAFVRFLLRDSFSALVAGLAFVFSGPVLVQLFPGHIFNPLPWFPLSLLLAELAVRRRRIIYYLLGGLVLALQVTAGHPQYMLYCFGALVLYFVYRAFLECRDSGSLAPLRLIIIGFAILLLFGIALSAVQLMPSWEFKDYSSRALLRGRESVREVSFPPENLVTLLVPGFFGDMQGVRYWGRWLFWETCLYVGMLPLLLALIGALVNRNRFTFFFSALAVLTVILSFGAYSPLFGFLYRFVPGFNLFRGQAKFISLAVFSLAVLAGYGCQLVTGPHPGRERRIIMIGRAALLLAAVLLLICLAMAASGGEHSSIWKRVIAYRVSKGFEGTPPPSAADSLLMSSIYGVAFRGILAAVIFIAASAATVLAAVKGKLKPASAKALIFTVALVDLWYYGSGYIITSPLSACYWPPGIAGPLKADHTAFRYLAPDIGIPGANQNMNEQLYAIGGYQTTNVGTFKEYVDFSQGITSREAKLTLSITKVTPMLEALGLKYLILSEWSPFNRQGYTRRLTSSGISIYEKRSPTPRAFIVHEAKVIKNTMDALEQVRLASGEPDGCIILEEECALPPPGPSEPGEGKESARIARELPMEVTINANLKKPGYLYLSDVFYPGWEVTLDGEHGTILRANHAFRAVALDEGSHTVRFVYLPRSFQIGARISVISLLVFVAALIVLLRRK